MDRPLILRRGRSRTAAARTLPTARTRRADCTVRICIRRRGAPGLKRAVCIAARGAARISGIAARAEPRAAVGIAVRSALVLITSHQSAGRAENNK